MKTLLFIYKFSVSIIKFISKKKKLKIEYNSKVILIVNNIKNEALRT